MKVSGRYTIRNRLRAQLRRHGTHCAYCGVEMVRYHSDRRIHPTRDHVIPLSRGGPDTLANITMACRRCNGDKGSLTGEEFMAWRAGLASRLDREGKAKRTLPVDNSKLLWFHANQEYGSTDPKYCSKEA